MQRRSALVRPFWAASVLVVGGIIACGTAKAQDSTGIRAVPTYEAVGLYWASPGANANGCDVQYRKSGESSWRQALPLWFDSSDNECRGSIVNLTPGATYEVQLGVGGVMQRSTTFTTWSNTKPVARTVGVASGSATLNVTEGGSAAGYVVYDGGGSATLDAQNGTEYNVTINASYVIVRGLTLKGAKTHGILISKDVHDVVIEDNDISGWGRTRDGTLGADMDSGIRAICQNQELTRVTIQRNKIHDPRYPANDWSTSHPAGPQGITFSYCGGNNVYRWNEIYSNNGNKFNDPMGGEDNYSTAGFPNRDSDIYGNRISDGWDDGIEADGGNTNVRIWGNYIDNTGTGISATLTSKGPLYIFRNVWNHNRFYANKATDTDERQPFMKLGSSSDFGNGRRYIFHNTMLQSQANGSSYPLGGGYGMGGTSSGNINNTISMNNIWHMYRGNTATYQTGTGNTFQNDMFNGTYGSAVVNGINAAPAYAAGNGWQSGAGGQYALAAGSPGFDQGVRIANFNDTFSGAAPDVGAAEAGLAPLKFGIAAADGATTAETATPATPAPAATPMSANGATRGTNGGMGVAVGTHPGGTATTSASTPGTPTTPTTPPTPTPTTPTTPANPIGATPISAGLDASSYSIFAGQSVTLTARLITASAPATGTVTFTENDSRFGCSEIPVSNSVASCTTTALEVGSHAIRGIYSGDASNSNGVAGPITITVK